MTTIPEIIATEILTSFLTPDGKEINNPTPLVCHTGLNRPLTLDERVDRMLAIKMSQHNRKLGGETIEEATDFNVEDEFESEPIGPHTFTEMDEEFLEDEKKENQANLEDDEKPKSAEPKPAEPAGVPKPEKPELKQEHITVKDGELNA